MARDTIQTDEGRFDVVFRYLDELQADEAGLEDAQASIRENEGIDELRRLSAEFAEAPKVSYTTT